VLGRYDITRGNLAGLYLDASARIGRAKTEFASQDIQYNGWNAKFDSAALYYGAHGGVGYLWRNGDNSLDLSARILWTRQESDRLTVYQDRVRFKAADSVRSRLGGRYSAQVNANATAYAGLYWEHEYDGKTRGAVNNIRLDAPSLKGDTGIGEMGLTLKPSRQLPLFLDLGVQGYTGKRDGVTGSVQVKFEF
jgi:outer membrane autotransporter protein